MNHKKYISIKTTQLENINFGAENIIEKKETLRYSLDETEFIIKWNEGFNTPLSVTAIPDEDKSNIMNHAEARTLTSNEAWTDSNIPNE